MVYISPPSPPPPPPQLTNLPIQAHTHTHKKNIINQLCRKMLKNIETTPKKIVRIALANAVHVVNRVLPYASHLFRLQMKACRIQRIQVKLDKYCIYINKVLPYASHLFRLQMKACRIQRIQVKLDKYCIYIYKRGYCGQPRTTQVNSTS